MKKIASYDDVNIYAPRGSRFSFLKSPYAAHKTRSAMDIYYGSFGSAALSPVDGEIIDVADFDTPTPFKGRDSREHLIAIRQGKYVVKIIHVKPSVPTGKAVSRGDMLGTFIKNGYFIFWNDPVMHVEVRKPDDYLRATNDLSLAPHIEWEELPAGRVIQLECRIEEINKRYALLSAPSQRCGDIRGYALDGGFLDGFISSNPEDGFFGIIKQEGFFNPKVSFEVSVGGTRLNCDGIAFSLSFKEPRIKVIPSKYGDELFSTGDTIHIKLGIY